MRQKKEKPSRTGQGRPKGSTDGSSCCWPSPGLALVLIYDMAWQCEESPPHQLAHRHRSHAGAPAQSGASRIKL